MNQSHTELAARIRKELAFAFHHAFFESDRKIVTLLEQCAAALKSPERVREEAVGFTPPSDCDSRKLCTVNGRCTGRYDTKAICLTPPTAPAQDAQGVSAILDALRVGRVACEWAEKTAEVQQIAAAMEIAKSMLSATPSPQAEKQPLSDEQIDALPWGPHEGNPITFAEGLRYFARAVERAHGIGVAK